MIKSTVGKVQRAKTSVIQVWELRFTAAVVSLLAMLGVMLVAIARI